MSKRVFVPLAVSLLFALSTTVFTGCGGGGEEVTTIKSISPRSGRPGEQIKLTGENFGKKQGKGYVSFSKTLNADISSWSESKIVCQVPSRLEPAVYDVFVQTASGKTSNKVSFAIEEEVVNRPPKTQPDNGKKNGEPEATEEEQKESGSTPGDSTANVEMEACKMAMITHAKNNSEEGMEFTVKDFWMSDDAKKAEAILLGARTDNAESEQEMEEVGIKAEKQGGNWAVTDFGTGIDLEHL